MSTMKFMKSAMASVAILAGAASAANAITVPLSKSGSGYFGDENWGTSVSRTIGTSVYNGRAGAFHLTDGINAFITFCIEPGVYINLREVFTVFEDAPVADKIDRLYNAAYHEVVDAISASAFQIALWEVITETSGEYDVTNGHHSAIAPSSTLANLFLDRLETAGTGKYKYTVYSNSGQDQLTATPVPLPASAVLLLAGLGGFAAFRRKS